MRTLFIVTCIMGIGMAVHAQFTYDYLRAADTYYQKADYSSAAGYYEKYLATSANTKIKTASYSPYTVSASVKKQKGPLSSRSQALYKLAESYRFLHDHARAATYYEKVLEEEFPLARFHYATSLRALGKYEEAEKEFNRYLDEYKTTDQYSDAAKKEVMSLRFIAEQLKKKDLKYYSIQKAAEPLNVQGANYAPVFISDSVMLFTTTRAEGHMNQVYATNVVKGDVNKFPLTQPGSMHQGIVSFTPDGNTLFLTRWTIQNAKKTSALYTSHKTGNGWSDPVLVDSIINVAGYNSQQPFVMPDGKHLLYASDRPGGAGGFDLWYAELDETGKPIRTANMGEVVNSLYDEQAPYYHAASGTLIFSANGRVGMGGYDFYYSKGSMDDWREPINFGYPVNSIKDDIHFVSRGGAKNLLEDVWLSSDREAVCCLELFYLKKIQPVKRIQGKVVACDDQTPLGGVTVQIIDTINNKVVYSQTTGGDGNYSFTLDAFQPLKAVAAASGFTTASLQFGDAVDEDAESLQNPAICLVRDIPPVETAIVLENVYYDFDKATLKPASHAALDKLAEMLESHPEIVVELSAHTDNIGTDAYNKRLSEARAQSCVNYLISKGIDAGRLQAKGYGATQPIASNDHAEGRQQNRRTEFKILK